MADTSNRYNLYGDLRITVKDVQLAANDAPGAIAELLVNALTGLIAGMEGLTQAQAEAARIMSDAKFSTAYRVDSANATVEAAVSAANGAATALEGAAAKARTALEQSFLPKAPSGFQGTPMDRIGSVTALLSNALQSDDQLTAFVLTTRMQFVYLAAGLKDDDVKQAFAQALGAQVNPDGSPKSGAALLSLLQRGGAGTVNGLIVVAKNLIYRQAEAFRANMARLAV